ncbi:MAG: carboxypeptidase-like regulatory domain-containing protein, partial [Cytophagales bacterium]
MRENLLKQIFALFLSVSTLVVFAQDRTITGRVTAAEDGSTLPGVNVVLKGTTIGTVTDSDGRFMLEVPASGGTLNFTFVGFVTQEIDLGSRTSFDITLVSDVTQLSEVVVTSYGQQDK